jgi:hypothetical protein
MLLAFVLLLVGGTFLVQNTLAANISLNTGDPVEFGQGIALTTACSGTTSITTMPVATFVNAAGTGSHEFSSLAVSNIPAGCAGVDFTINAYGDSSATPLALFNSTSTSAVVYDNAGNFELGVGATGMSITSGSDTFTVTFTVPVATTASVYKITMQSGPHTVVTCALGGPCSVDGAGPGGGTIYYYNASGFSCGAGYSVTGSPEGGLCHYLEVAPNTWGGGSTDPGKTWAQTGLTGANVSGISDDGTAKPYPNLSAAAIGLGFKNSNLIVDQGNDVTTAAGATRAYAGGSKNDWYLPTMTELNLLCRWAKGNAVSITTVCTGGSYVKGDLTLDAYWSSSEASSTWSWYLHFNSNYLNAAGKTVAQYIRPIRAF